MTLDSGTVLFDNCSPPGSIGTYNFCPRLNYGADISFDVFLPASDSFLRLLSDMTSAELNASAVPQTLALIGGTSILKVNSLKVLYGKCEG
jgi:hypothetical protein